MALLIAANHSPAVAAGDAPVLISNHISKVTHNRVSDLIRLQRHPKSASGGRKGGNMKAVVVSLQKTLSCTVRSVPSSRNSHSFEVWNEPMIKPVPSWILQ